MKRSGARDFEFFYDAALGHQRLCWDYLRVSPSYYLVHQHVSGQRKLSASLRKRLNLSLVEKTYEVMGNVYDGDFKTWYRRSARPAFVQGYQLMPAVVARWPNIDALRRAELVGLNAQLKRELSYAKARQAGMGGLLLFVPAAGDPEHLSIYIAHQLRLERNRTENWIHQLRPGLDYQLDHSSKHQVLKLWQNLALVRYRAENWQQSVWQVAAGLTQYGWQNQRASLLDPAGERRTESDFDRRNRRIVTAQLDNRFATILRLAENAARGAFPSTQAVNGAAEWEWNDGIAWERLRQLGF